MRLLLSRGTGEPRKVLEGGGDRSRLGFRNPRGAAWAGGRGRNPRSWDTPAASVPCWGQQLEGRPERWA